MAKTVKDAYGEILRLRNEFYQKWQEVPQYDENRDAYKAKYEAFVKVLELLTPSIVDPQPKDSGKLTHSVTKISDQEPISEDMEKAAKVYEQIRNDLDVVSDNQMVERAFKAGAYWQKEQLFRWKESVKLWSEKDENSFEDEFAKTLAEKKEILPQGENRFSDLDLYRVALHFSGWKQRQMMKDAVEGYVDMLEFPEKTWIELSAIPKDLKDGDKVKLLIIKEE